MAPERADGDAGTDRPAAGSDEPAAGPPLRLAHRGDHRHWIENTAGALIEACRLPGIDGVEFDIRHAADGEPVVLHDRSLDRAFGLPLIAGDVPVIELMRAGVPHLADMLALLPPDAFLDIELKEPATAATIDAILRSRGHGLELAVVSSFEPSVLAAVRARQPHWPIWLNAVTLHRPSIGIARALGASGIAARWPSVSPAAVHEAAADGLTVAAWTVTRRPTRARLERLGVAAVVVEGAALEP